MISAPARTIFCFLVAAPLLLAANPAWAQASGGKTLPLDEYNEVPQGLLLPQAAPAPVKEPAKEGPVAGEEEVMTIEDLMAAYQRGDYALVAQRIIPLAERKHPVAAELLGVMYHNGQGVSKSIPDAVIWLKAAAEAGRPLAQHHLAIMHFTGEGVEKDPAAALMWLHVAIIYYPDGADKKRAQQDRDNLLPQLSRRDRDRAYALAREWLDRRGDALLLDLQ